MNQTEARTVVFDAIVTIAPDADPTAVPGDADLMEELELDSIDLVSIATRIQLLTGVEIPERDYHRLETLDGFIDYVAAVTNQEDS